MNILDTHFIGIPAKVFDTVPDSTDIVEVFDDNGQKYYVRQDPLLQIFDESPASLFYELRGQKADVFASRLIPSIPVRQAVDYYEAFNLQSPSYVLREGLELKPVYKDTKKKLSKALAFSSKPTLTDKDIEEKRKKKSKPAALVQKNENTAGEPTRRPGRPKGSKNKKTLEREAEALRLGIVPPPKRPRGRPKGSKNRKTLEKEALEARETNKAENKRNRKKKP